MNHRNALSLAMRGASLCVAAWIAGTATDALAVTVYKLTDNDGRITYSSQPPRGFSGTVVTLDFEATAAAVEAAEAPGAVPARTRSENEKTIRGPTGAGDYSEINLAEARLDEAIKALEYARDNSTAEDWIYHVRKLSRGSTRHPTPEYADRLERLDQSVKEAETNLAQAEGRYRRSF